MADEQTSESRGRRALSAQSLLACPFCGVAPDMEDVMIDTGAEAVPVEHVGYAAFCRNSQCPSMDHGAPQTTKAEAAERWNTRAR